MELYYPIQSSWPFFPAHPFLLSSSLFSTSHNNAVHWVETPEAHIFSADLPGVRKEEIRVEVEDSRYMVIRTELTADGAEREPPSKKEFMRKFRMPEMIDLDGITAAYEDGVLTVTVPRSVSRRRLRLDPAVVADGRNSVARAA